ncbi:MAG: hypothetical protein M5R36_23125 [Deltaproteobacteria bacterium]|nr:hypothetical protein [Deltaproteobacteria bacterium]
MSKTKRGDITATDSRIGLRLGAWTVVLYAALLGALGAAAARNAAVETRDGGAASSRFCRA